MPKLGLQAPPFRLPDTQGKMVELGDFASSKALLVMFICNHCPYVQHVREELAKLGREYLGKGAAIVAINSNDPVSHPEDSPAAMKREARDAGYTFPYLFDETQDVAKRYAAACTPDFFLYDSKHKLVYRGQLDDSRPGNGKPVTGADLRAALDAVLGGGKVSASQKPSIGCNIKWRTSCPS